jgi:DNA-binding PadR family transcriptional regulator
MARLPDRISRMEILLLSALARAPMHGWDIKLELRYKHARWWAKVEHGHLYATLARLERDGAIRQHGSETGRRKVFALTPSGRERLIDALRQLGPAPDNTHFDIDLFLSGAFALDRGDAVELLRQRRVALEAQVAEAEGLQRSMSRYVPAAAHLIIEHRTAHLRAELAFATRAADALLAQETWGAFLGAQPIGEFVAATDVPLEADEDGPPGG